MAKKLMKKKIAVIVTVLALILGTSISITAKAEKARISSKNNVEFQSGEAAFYAEDIYYLQRELIQLFNEVNK